MSARAAAVAEPSVNRVLIDRINMLREIDSVIDLARGWLQIRLLLAIGERGVSVDALSATLGQPRKTILDALRKMRLKGLVEESKGYYRLAERGLNLYRMLVSLASPTHKPASRGIQHVSVYDILSSLTRHIYLYEALVALGSSPRYEMTLEELASVVRLSPRQLDEYLSVYSNGSLRLLERSLKRCGVLRNRTCVYYRIGRDGKKILYRLPEYMRVKRSWATRILVKLTRALHPRLVLKRLTLLLSIGSAISMSLVILFPRLGVLILGSWVLFISFLALLIGKSY